mmetsp:Transcript_16032/g.37153  ORF Transcript_16032/g.37153 Transcript_16032/m.37153 type:complete len:87 (+) Transcript_16032:1145-1405(+)
MRGRLLVSSSIGARDVEEEIAGSSMSDVGLLMGSDRVRTAVVDGEEKARAVLVVATSKRQAAAKAVAIEQENDTMLGGGWVFGGAS